MRYPRTLWLFLAREVVLFTGFGLAALVPLLVSRNLLQVLDERVVVELSAPELPGLVGCVALMLAPYALPIAFLLGALLAVGRMAADREVAALRACGQGLRSLLLPVLGLGAGASVLTGWLMLDVEHRAQRELRARLQIIATRGTWIEPGEPLHLGERMLFARERRPDGDLGGVLVSDRSDPERPLLVAAERGRVIAETGRFVLKLRDGDLFPGGPGGPRIGFETFETALPAAALLGARRARLRPREMAMSELVAIVARAEAGEPLDGYRKQNPEAYRLQIHRRLALPVAPAVFALLAVPLGMRARRNARAWAGVACAVLVSGYYTMLMFGQFLALEGTVPAAAAVWAPNGAFAATGFGLALAARRPGS